MDPTLPLAFSEVAYAMAMLGVVNAHQRCALKFIREFFFCLKKEGFTG
jgi:hypothetical protein